MPLDVSMLFKDFRNMIPEESFDSARLQISHKGFNITSYATSFRKIRFFTPDILLPIIGIPTLL